ncbi:30S ribosomal protein S8 [Candidatus Uhrbacteria bacterium CG_4_10_14_0_8_um_filter_58_22]|uniref:Small ribosomal subunit protein uS8 n=1 Tax=Candidatus Uhrbacteria bacterium CG_4_10_14_0_8_um_filter_58_22 TaxID=1975029 RepID=A0A2M7QAW6_9BACT|nr:MAG: 30S ribosomal protein S8 [Parcubacteria group bacterium CG1_02_58_44]PIY62391.1 MAG: 30S ribosomal protein S8 [Candidatus Uhrbacteria bacterium CG_4_10_14_0_8_um_filter_58_22]
MITDPISDMLTRIRNAYMVKKAKVCIPYSNMKYAIAKILATEGYVSGIEKLDVGFGEICLSLRYDRDGSAITNIRRISRPGRRSYSGYRFLPRVRSDHGIAIVSTSQGIMTNREARKRKLGGEVLCEIF